MSVLDLEDAKVHLNITGDAEDDTIQAAIDSAEATIALRCGPLAATTVTRRLSGNGAVLALPITPVVELTSVTPYQGAALTVGNLYVDQVSGLVTNNNLTGFPSLYYDVVYEAGRQTCPDDLLFAVKELVRHIWQPRRGPRSANSASTDIAGIGTSWRLLPDRIAEMIAPHVQVGVG